MKTQRNHGGVGMEAAAFLFLALWSAQARAAGTLAAGDDTSCAIRGRAVYCWGGDDDRLISTCGRLQPHPVMVTKLGSAKQIAVGRGALCALKSSGGVACFGLNGDYRLGPLLTKKLTDAIAIATGGSSSCAIRRGGDVVCWSQSDATGYDTNIADAVSLAMSDSGSACAVRRTGGVDCWESESMYDEIPGVAGAVGVAVSVDHACAVLGSGRVVCWGGSEHGQRGRGGQGGQKGPTPIEVVGIEDATAVSVGKLHSCALLRSGRVRCWGRNDVGQLGDGTTVDRDAPVDVVGLGDAVSIVSGARHTCVERSSGEISCWGDNHDGQIGDGTSAEVERATDVPGVENAAEVATGGNRTCARLRDGAVWCWGPGVEGPGRLQSPNLAGITALLVSDGFACALSSDQRVRCWSGHLGGGQLVDPLPWEGVDDAESFVAGQYNLYENNFCIRRRDHRLLCVGVEANGSVTLATKMSASDHYVELDFARAMSSVSIGTGMMCGLEPRGTVACWGDEAESRPHDSPTRLPGLGDAVAVVTGWGEQCALRRGGQVACGRGWDRPSAVPKVTQATAVAGAGSRFCALERSGRVSCWNKDRQDLAGCYLAPLAVDRVAGLRDAEQLSADADHACVVRRTGQIACWGNNDDGALGIGRTAYRPGPTSVELPPAQRRRR